MRSMSPTFASLLLALLAACQPVDRGASELAAEDRAAVAAEAEQAIEAYMVAIRNADVDAMPPAWADVEGFALAADGEIISSHADLTEGIETAWADVGQMLEMETWNPHTYVLGPDAASHTIEYRWTMTNVAGDTARSHGSWLYVLERFDEGWKIVQSAGTHLYDGNDVAAIRNVQHDYFAAHELGDVDAVMALVDGTPLWMPPGEPTISDRDAVQEYARGIFGGWAMTDIRSPAEVAAFGDWGYSASTEVTWTSTPRAGGESVLSRATGLMIAHRGEDGQWRFARSMWNQVTPGEDPTPVVGTEPVELVASGPDADIAAIKEYFERYEAVVGSKDMEAMANLWTDDVVWMPPGAPALTGNEAAMRMAGDFLESHDVALDMNLEEIRTAEGMAYVLVSASGQYIPLAEGGEPADFMERELFILERQDDGAWQGTHCIWNADVQAG